MLFLALLIHQLNLLVTFCVFFFATKCETNFLMSSTYYGNRVTCHFSVEAISNSVNNGMFKNQNC